MPLVDWIPGIKFIIGTPEQRLIAERTDAQKGLAQAFDRVVAQRTIVATKHKEWQDRQAISSEAQTAMQRTAKLYEDAITTMPEGSDEIISLKANFIAREQTAQQCSARVSEARKDLDVAMQTLNRLEKAQKEAEVKLDQLCNRASIPSDIEAQKPVTSTRLTVAQEFEQFRQQAEQTSSSALRKNGKVVASANVSAHFDGKNKEHMETDETVAVRHELQALKKDSRFGVLKDKIGSRLKLGIAMPSAGTPSHASTIIERPTQVDAGLKVKLQRALAFEHDPEDTPTRLPFLVSLQAKFNQPATAFVDQPDVRAMRFPDLMEKSRRGSLSDLQTSATRPSEKGLLQGEINEAITARRRKSGF